MLLVAAATLLIGFPYYGAPIGERLRHPLHDWFKPSGYVGQSAGIVTFLLFAFMWLYPLRKRLRRLSGLGSLGRWLDVHVVAGLTLPVIGAIHASWRFQGVIGLGYWAMLAVCASGVVGRYLYTRIPRGRGGLELTLAQVQAGRRELIGQLAQATGLAAERIEGDLDFAPSIRPTRSLPQIFAALVSNDLARWRYAGRLRRLWRRDAGRTLDRSAVRRAIRLARREIALTQQLQLLEATHRIFRFWHVAHRPFAVTALLAVTIHVVVVILLGVTWIR